MSEIKPMPCLCGIWTHSIGPDGKDKLDYDPPPRTTYKDADPTSACPTPKLCVLEDPGMCARYLLMSLHGPRESIFNELTRLARPVRRRGAAPVSSDAPTAAGSDLCAWWVFKTQQEGFQVVDAVDQDGAWVAALPGLGLAVGTEEASRKAREYAVVKVRAADIGDLQQRFASLVDAARRAISCEAIELPQALLDLELALRTPTIDAPTETP